MPQATPQDKQQKVIEMKTAGRSYTQIAQELKMDNKTIAKILRKAGLTRAAAPAAGVPSTPAVPAAAVAAPAAVASSGLAEFQPPAPPKPRPAGPATTSAAPTPIPEAFTCAHCGTQFRLDPGETLESAKCPGCGQ